MYCKICSLLSAHIFKAKQLLIGSFFGQERLRIESDDSLVNVTEMQNI